MPNRIIKESVCTSEKLSQLSDFEFRLWIGLLTCADDAGRGDARPAILKGRVFPLRERVAIKDIENALSQLAARGCIALYEVCGRPYFWFPTWKVHQRIRNCKPKYPEPPADGCGGLRQSAADCGELPPESNPIRIQSESESESNVSVSHSRFAPPTIDEVKAYCQERRNSVDPQRFVDFYASKGWMVGKSKMKDWQACVRTWEKDDAGKKSKVYTAADYDDDKDILGR